MKNFYYSIVHHVGKKMHHDLASVLMWIEWASFRMKKLVRHFPGLLLSFLPGSSSYHFVSPVIFSILSSLVCLIYDDADDVVIMATAADSKWRETLFLSIRSATTSSPFSLFSVLPFSQVGRWNNAFTFSSSSSASHVDPVFVCLGQLDVNQDDESVSLCNLWCTMTCFSYTKASAKNTDFFSCHSPSKSPHQVLAEKNGYWCRQHGPICLLIGFIVFGLYLAN